MLRFPGGKTQIVRDNKTQKSIMFNNYVIDDLENPPRVILSNGRQVVAKYDCTVVEINGKKFPVVDRLDAVASQG